jgi:glutamate--cysteine ligase catalytic subunit
LGCPGFTHPLFAAQPKTSVTGSLFFPDEAIFPGHPRYRTLAQNIRARRGRKVILNIPVYKDVKTPDPFIEEFPVDDDVGGEAAAASKSDHVYLDAMGFGMGCCCLQVTFQASDLHEAVTLYDQLTPVTPIAMALSASSPVHRGYLTDRDCRWDVISQAVDDRTKEELGEEPLKNDGIRISKSRYDSIDSYLSASSSKYNDVQLVYNEHYYDMMVKEGVEQSIAKHIAHLFIRDPITLYAEKMHQDNENETDHFENIQSTNWQNMRFKPPPPNSPIGWRVEFRPMEVQVTDFENAAFTVFVVLLTRVILSYRLNLLIPISKVDENMKEAQKRDAVKRSRFWFRKDIMTPVSPPEAAKCLDATGCPSASIVCEEDKIDESCILMTANEIINGSSQFPGLVPLLKQYLLTVDVDAVVHCAINQYLNLISGRASGSSTTTAQWIRQFVQKHPQYKQDSVVNERINYDLIKTLSKISKGELNFKDLSDPTPSFPN